MCGPLRVPVVSGFAGAVPCVCFCLCACWQLFFRRMSDGGAVASGEDDDAAGHLEEDGAAECLGEILSAGGLSVVGHQDDVVVCKGLYYRCGEFVRAGREERYYGSRVTLKSLGLSFMQATTVAYGDWKCRTHPTSGLLRMTPR